MGAVVSMRPVISAVSIAETEPSGMILRPTTLELKSGDLLV